MHEVTLDHPADLAGWRRGARALLAAGVPPAAARWRLTDEPADLFAAAPPPPPAGADAPAVPRAFVELAATVIRHRAPERFDLLYRLLWRQVRGERGLLALRTDADVARAMALAHQVRRDAYHMRAYVRFRESHHDGRPLFLAWFAPEHHVLELVAPHFAARMGTLRWSILTPAQSAHWDGSRLHYAEGRPEAPPQDEDGMVECWKTYYASIFNPARLKVDAMLAQMPRKYWAAMDETALIPDMVRAAQQRTETMLNAAPTAPNTKGRVRVCRDAPAADASPADLDGLAAHLPGCRRCDLWRHATQAVPGRGPAGAAIMVVGEQPGDHEDLAGVPFVGPAGQMLDRALEAAGLERGRLYVTNAVKHFKYQAGGGNSGRLHCKPDAGEVEACRWWLDHELALVKPRLVVALGATAAASLLGRTVAVLRERGTVQQAQDRPVLVTLHPAAILRQPDAADRDRLFGLLSADLALAARMTA